MLAADMTQDSTVNISDVNALIDYLTGGSSKSTLRRISSSIGNQFMTTSDVLVVPATSLRAGETRTIDVALDNNERGYIALQSEIVMPEGVKLVAVEGIDRGREHSYYLQRNEVEQNVYSLIGVSMSLDAYAGNQGNVMRLTVTASDDYEESDAALTFTNVMLVNRQHQIYLSNDAMGMFTDATAVEHVTADKEIASVRYVNVAGQQSETPFDGVNIVITTYTDGTISTVKVMK